MVDQPRVVLTRDLSNDSIDDAEKGMYHSTPSVTAPAPFAYVGQEKAIRINTNLSQLSPVHEGITPNPSIPDLSLSWPAASPAARRGSINAAALETTVPKKPAPAKPEIPKWVLADLWFNTYRKFFTLIVLLNLTGIIMTALGRFSYAENHLGALVLGNLLAAILFRNELWMRFLYMVAIYGLRGVSAKSGGARTSVDQTSLVGPALRQVCSYICSAARRRDTFGMCSIRRSVSDHPLDPNRTNIARSWLVYKIVDIIRYRAVQHPAVITSGIITNVFIIISVLSAFPWIRKSVIPSSALHRKD